MHLIALNVLGKDISRLTGDAPGNGGMALCPCGGSMFIFLPGIGPRC